MGVVVVDPVTVTAPASDARVITVDHVPPTVPALILSVGEKEYGVDSFSVEASVEAAAGDVPTPPPPPGVVGLSAVSVGRPAIRHQPR